VPRAVPAPPAAPAQKPPIEIRRYRVDPAASSITAVATAVMGRYTFRILRFEGSIEWAPREIAKSRLSLEVDMRSVTGTVGIVTKIVRSADFLDVERYPSASFSSAELVVDGANSGRVRGVLQLHGVTRSIEVPGSFRVEGSRLLLESEFLIDRREFGIENDGAIDVLVGDDVTVRLALVARREPSPPRTPVRTQAGPTAN
jgi:polyisoprenoid-binding protein YceI